MFHRFLKGFLLSPPNWISNESEPHSKDDHVVTFDEGDIGGNEIPHFLFIHL
jgi:hypothetical protein